MFYMRKNNAYNEDAILELAKQQLEDVPEDEIKEQIASFRNWARRYSEAKGLDKVVAALDDLTMASDILDEEIKSDKDVETAKELVNDAFKTIIDEYAKRCALDTYNGITFINLTNLLSFINSATDNEYTAEVVFQNILRVINEPKSKYRIVDSGYTEDEYIARAKMSSEELDEFISNDSVQKINLASFLSYLEQQAENAEEFENAKAKILEAVANAKVGDKLEYSKTDKGRIEIKSNGTVIGSMPIPNVNNEGTHYIMINEGWKTDVPFGEDGNSDFYNLLNEIFVNEDNEDIVNLIRQASHTTDKEAFKNAAKIILDKIRDLDNIDAKL